MKYFIYICFLFFLFSCTSNTMYKKPENVIPKDSMVSFLTEMYIASSAKNIKNKYLKKEKNYVMYVYHKYKIDTVRFDISNAYYTSKIEEYTEMLEKVKFNIDSIKNIYDISTRIPDSGRYKKKLNKKKILEDKLIEKNSKLIKKEKIDLEKFK